MTSTETIDRLREALQIVFLHHPEVAALAISITWRGEDTPAEHGIWIGPDGPVSDAATILASTQQTLRMLDVQLGRGFDLLAILEQRIAAAASQLGELRETPEEAQPDPRAG